MKQIKKVLAIVIALVLSISMMQTTNVSAATNAKLNKKKATIYVGKTVTLKLKNNKKKVKWSSSNKRVATVSSKGKVKGKKAGKATITAKVGKKKYKCKITVKKKVVKKQNNYNNYYDTQYVEKSVKEKIADACMTYGKSDSDSSGIYYYLDTIDTSSTTTYYTQVRYIQSSDVVRISLLTDTGILVYFDMEDINSTTCAVTFYDDNNGYFGDGTLYKALINETSAVAFTSTNMGSSLQQTAEKLTTASAKLSLYYFDDIMGEYSVGVTHRDLGFDF